ncbi:MAG: cupin domain-containing protein [Micropruina sp.]|uniref:cupin domain-containing protein n=1 Tax=Micropruina sp. TaxID=2737536 RepID=UPI0039E2A952
MTGTDTGPTFIRLGVDEQGDARFVDWRPTMRPEHPGLHELSVSDRLDASSAVVVRGPAGGGHPTQPESSRQLVVVLSGSFDITATGETRTVTAGDVVLVEDTHGRGHSSETHDGAVALMIALHPASNA